jgi:hypothetical protein
MLQYLWPHRLTVRTEPSQGSNTGSIPVEATNPSYSSIIYTLKAVDPCLLISRIIHLVDYFHRFNTYRTHPFQLIDYMVIAIGKRICIEFFCKGWVKNPFHAERLSIPKQVNHTTSPACRYVTLYDFTHKKGLGRYSLFIQPCCHFIGRYSVGKRR